jgi:glycosyltransferase involved in cell wall biosynthesis
MLFGLARAHPADQFLFCYRPHRLLRSFGDSLPPNARRRVLRGNPGGRGTPGVPLFHALNQRVDVPARRTVCTFHDLFVISGDYSSPDFRARFTAQARDAAARSDLIVAVSQFTANQVEHLLHVEPSRIRVIPHGANPAAPVSSRRENLILTVGAIQKRKNIARLVEAFERSPRGWRLAIAGAADGYGAEEELRAMEQSPRRGDIDLLGYVPNAQLEALYGRASIFAFPSLDEGFGMPVLDAMARGVPVVASRRSALPEVAGDAALLVDPENVEELGDALLRLSGDEQLRAELAIRGRQRAAEFTWERAVDHTWRVYQELL